MISNVRVTGGKLNFKALNLTLLKTDEAKYNGFKAHFWLNMINKMENPVHWYKPNKNGTAVKFETIQNQHEYDKALIDLEYFLKDINEKHGFDFNLSRSELSK